MTSCRSILCLGLALSVAGCSDGERTSYAVDNVPLTQISTDLTSGKATSAAITAAYIERINAYDGAFNAVIAIAPDALEQAEASDARRKAGRTLGPLDGVPILIKDNIDAVGMPTTAGTFALAENVPVQDAELTRRLRGAGAVILGKTNLSQLSGGRTARAFAGSTVGGTPQNPYDLKRSAAGSSNGSGISVAVSFAAAAIGTDTTGSVIAPSAYMGLVGMRPTLALVSRRGIVPLSLSQDTAGPMARTVADAATVLTVIAGSDRTDPASQDADANKTDYVKGLNREALKGARLGVVRGAYGYDEKTAAVFNAALDVMVKEGATLIEVPVSDFEDLSGEQRLLMNYEYKEDLEAYLAQAPATVKTRTFADVMSFHAADPRENMHGHEMFEDSIASGGRAAPGYATTLEYVRRQAGPRGLGLAISQHNLSALVFQTHGPARVREPDGSERVAYLRSGPKGTNALSPSAIAALAGYPDLTVPMGELEGLPLGVSFIGLPWSEQTLLSLGYAYEQASQMRRAPPAPGPAPKGSAAK